ncbi:DUF3892 domain-containing protein [Streptomyces sp. NPDC006184]|uniref:DUF3892 domain-containing protein n=1 Tax=Streptomyces sp. NPDC006184 TaxID=3155455 RepID=UPI0033A86AD8
MDNPATAKTGDNTRAEIVTWIEDEKGHAYTSDAGGHRAEVAVVTPPRGEKYLQTRADGVWTNNWLFPAAEQSCPRVSRKAAAALPAHPGGRSRKRCGPPEGSSRPPTTWG